MRNRPRLNYKEPSVADIYSKEPSQTLPKTKLTQKDVYPIEVVDEDSSTSAVKVHYIGYSSRHDEWKPKQDIIILGDDPDPNPDTQEPGTLAEPFSLNQELASKIKAALNSGRKESPVVKIDMPFDRAEYDCGLRTCGTQKRLFRAVQHYRISHYQDLDKLLGHNWHYRGLNSNGDFCFVLLNTVEYYLHKRRSLKEYIPTQCGQAIEQYREMGDMLVFSFVKGNGTPDKFGIDKDIFFLKFL